MQCSCCRQGSRTIPPSPIAIPSRASAVIPSARGTSCWSRIEERMDPRATVTTRSKALSLANVRFPEIRRKHTRQKYARKPTTRVRTIPSHPWKNISPQFIGSLHSRHAPPGQTLVCGASSSTTSVRTRTAMSRGRITSPLSRTEMRVKAAPKRRMREE